MTEEKATMTEEKETTVLNTSVGADAGQPNQNLCDDSLADSLEEYNRYFRQLNDPSYLPTVSMRELYETAYESKPPLIDGLLYPGTYLLVGAPKLGKSFLVAQLAYHVSTGTPLWNYPVRQGTVLYLALEDDNQRLQSRMYQMFDMEIADQLFFATRARQLGKGLDEQLERFVREHPDTRLIIIDTLQKVREIGGEAYSYASDYDIITRLKSFADCRSLCLILVHHTRKQKADDVFDMISGTNGLLGAADGAFLLQKPKRTANEATLDISGRDQQDQRLHLFRNEEKLCWELRNRAMESAAGSNSGCSHRARKCGKTGVDREPDRAGRSACSRHESKCSDHEAECQHRALISRAWYPLLEQQDARWAKDRFAV